MELNRALASSLGKRVRTRAKSGALPMKAAARSSDFDDESLASTRAVILAGGRGARLAPYTSVLPKPLMPIGERAILEIVVEQLEAHGVKDITFCVGYLSHLIRTVFDNRANGHVNIRYVHERELLGTAGPLRLVDGLEETFIVMNGDVLTTLDYRNLVRHHRETGNAITIATRERTIKIDYGVLGVENKQAPSPIVRFDEKPEVHSTVSMGVTTSRRSSWRRRQSAPSSQCREPLSCRWCRIGGGELRASKNCRDGPGNDVTSGAKARRFSGP